jgi:hypothetical protein
VEPNELEEIKENQKRLGSGLIVVSELLEKILAEVQSGGLATQVRFRGDKPEFTRRKPAHRGAGIWP